MRRLTLVPALLLSVCAAGQSVNSLLKEASAYKNAHQESQALAKYNEVLLLEESNLYALCGASFMNVRIGRRQTSEDAQRPYFETANDLANRALGVNPAFADANYVKAAAMGSIGLISPTRQRIEASKEVKSYSELALKYNKEHARAWHTLGRWHFEVKKLGLTKMVLIKALYGGLPKASFEAAVECFQKAIRYKPGYILYYLDLAKAYIALDEDANAQTVLNNALALPNSEPDDASHKSACRELLDKL